MNTTKEEAMIEVRPVERPAPVEVVTPIRPSEAIRLGSLIRPRHGAGQFFGPDGAACVLGAMAVGFGYTGPFEERDASADPYHIVDRELPATLPDPNRDGEPRHASQVLFRLNDTYDWSRERIADWLESLGL